MAATYGQRPSGLLGLPGESWEAFQLDHATLALGRWVEAKLAERDKSGKPIHRLERLLDDKPGTPTQEFAPLAALVDRKMVIPESGVW